SPGTTATTTPTPPTPASNTPAPTAAATTPQVARAEPTAPAASATPYILQAGAFQASGDAEATKAKIALLGLNARVESAQISGKTVYRVRMGPYASATELAEAKQKLENGGLPAMAIKAK
ncbi:MAG: SPOR domain-containing protein, partial [Pseudomonadota bacterium]|nr:SPOR domain-containing protein [Pseudomonadota bacterium]